MHTLKSVYREEFIDGIILLAIPAILAGIYYLLPIPLQQTFALDHTNPSIYSFWTNSFIHNHQPRDGHLIGNIIGYTLLTVPCWTLYYCRQARRRFWIGLLILLTAGPLVASISSYAAFHEVLGLQIEADRGFSGVVGAIDGFLLMSLLRTFAQEQEETVAVLSMGIYFAYLIIGLGAVTSRFILMGLGVLALITVFVGTRTKYIAVPHRLSEWGEQNRRLSIVIVVAAFVSTLALAASLPADITNASGGIKNIVAHGTGILFGMLVGRSLQLADQRDLYWVSSAEQKDESGTQTET